MNKVYARGKKQKRVSLHFVLLRMKINLLKALRSVLAIELKTSRVQMIHVPIRPFDKKLVAKDVRCSGN